MGHQGWSNRETAAVNMWFGEHIAETYVDEDPTEVELKEFVRMMIMEFHGGLVGLARDLLICSLNRVNWQELADAYKQEQEFLYDEF